MRCGEGRVIIAVTILAMATVGCSGRYTQFQMIPVSGYKLDSSGRFEIAGWGQQDVKEREGGLYEILVRGSPATPLKRVEKMAEMRAALLAREAGRSHVLIVSSKAGLHCRSQGGRVTGATPEVKMRVRLGDSLDGSTPLGFSVDERFAELVAATEKRDFPFEERVKFARELESSCYSMKFFKH